jgi:NAD(P)-dependent dehydrogenase (short-subunit alcohol dehydrogenase family)
MKLLGILHTKQPDWSKSENPNVQLGNAIKDSLRSNTVALSWASRRKQIPTSIHYPSFKSTGATKVAKPIIPHVFLFVALLGSYNLVNATGIAMLKEQAFHDDASAKPLVYSRMTDSGASFAVFEAAGKRISVEKRTITALLNIPDAIPPQITLDAELEPLRKSLADMKAFAKRFPQTEKLLANSIEILAGHIAKYDSGHQRFGGKWMTKAESASLMQEMKTKADTLNKDELDRQHAKEQFEAEQRDKGLILFEGRWIEQTEFELIRKQRAELLKKLRAVPLPLVVIRDFKAAWPGAGVTHRLIQFKTGQRFALMPATGGGKFKFQTLRFEDEIPVTAYRELPLLDEYVTVDLPTVNGLQEAAVTWGITLKPIATRAEGLKRLIIQCSPAKPAIPNGHPATIAMVVERVGDAKTSARLDSWVNLTEQAPNLFECTLTSLDQVKQAMARGVMLVDGAGNTTAPAFPKESDFPDMAELAAAVNAYGQFKLNQDLVKARINGLKMEMDSLRKQESILNTAISAAQTKANDARLRINASRDLLRARAQYEAAQSEIKTIQAQIAVVRQSRDGLWKQSQAAEKELIKLD